MRVRISTICSGILLAATSHAIAGAVDASDLAGKTICWSGSGSKGKATYEAGGKFLGSRSGVGTWSLSGSVLTIVAEKRNYSMNIEKRPDGTFSLTWGDFVNIGTYCK